MPRQRRPFQRKLEFRDASLFVIACEGAVTEPKYFNGLKEKLHASRIRVLILQRLDASRSSPEAIKGMMNNFVRLESLRDGDQLWLVIDRDSWPIKTISEVAQDCHQKGYFLAVSNPCFEFWLLLHFEDVANQAEERKKEIFQNKKDFLKKEIVRILEEYPNAHSIFDFDDFDHRTKEAVRRARQMDDPNVRWPDGLGTRVHLLVGNLISLS